MYINFTLTNYEVKRKMNNIYVMVTDFSASGVKPISLITM